MCVCVLRVVISSGAARRGGADDVLQGRVAGFAGAVQEKPDQVPAPFQAPVLRQARPEAAVQGQLERTPGEGSGERQKMPYVF